MTKEEQHDFSNHAPPFRSPPNPISSLAAVAERPINGQRKTHLDYLAQIADDDVKGLKVAEQSYGSSWKKRGGVGAYMMLARKFDRIEKALAPKISPDVREKMLSDLRSGRNVEVDLVAKALSDQPWDIFSAAERDERTEGLIDDIRDLRRYLLLVEAELLARGVSHGVHRDNQ